MFINLTGAFHESVPTYLNHPTEEALDATTIVHLFAQESLIPQGLLLGKIIIDSCFCK